MYGLIQQRLATSWAITVCTIMHSILYSRVYDGACCLCSRECHTYVHTCTYVPCIRICALLPSPACSHTAVPFKWVLYVPLVCGAEQAGGSKEEEMVDVEREEVYSSLVESLNSPFSILPDKGILEPKEARTFIVTFCPQKVCTVFLTLCVCAPNDLYAEVCVCIVLFIYMYIRMCIQYMCSYSSCIYSLLYVLSYNIHDIVCVYICTCRLVSP